MKYSTTSRVMLSMLILTFTTSAYAAIKSTAPNKEKISQKQKIASIITNNIFQLHKKIETKAQIKIEDKNTEPVEQVTIKPTINTDLILSGITIINKIPTAFFYNKRNRQYVPYKLNDEISIGKIDEINITSITFSSEKKQTKLIIGQNLLAQDTKLTNVNTADESESKSENKTITSNTTSKTENTKKSNEQRSENKQFKKKSSSLEQLMKKRRRSRNR